MNRRWNVALCGGDARICLVTLACFSAVGATVHAAPMPALMDAGLARTVESVLPIARRKLMGADCRRIFLEFRDGSGRPLLRNLEAIGKIPPEHLMGLAFRDGSAFHMCRRPGVLAASLPGESVVQLCSPRFQEVARRSPSYAAVILIHEQLHALGLEENPPSSEEITYRVALRCGW